jgi:salicylate hydroxylase
MTAARGDRRVLISGGGIGGLALAIALAERGQPVTVLERGALHDETGAGIQLGANALRRLDELGVLDLVVPEAFRPDALWMFDAHSGARLTALPLGEWYLTRYQAPYLSLHRADLHRGLYRRACMFPEIRIEPGVAVTDISQHASTVSAKGFEGQDFSGSCLVGADGLWSTARQLVAPDAKLAFAGQTASRTLLATRNLATPFDAPVVTLWLGTRGHLVTYPVKSGKALNVVLVTEGGSPHQGWNEEMDAASLLAATAGWAEPPRRLLAGAEHWRSWSLFQLPPLRRWSKGNVALLGDAAHPVLPFLAQGAGLAIEDALVLARQIVACGRDHRLAFAEYERLRRRRVARVQAQSARLGRIYHMGPPWRSVRNLAIAKRDPESALSRLDWLYGG